MERISEKIRAGVGSIVWRVSNNSHVRMLFASIFMALILLTCVSPFEPEISESASLMTIDGSIIKGEEVQSVVISRSSSIEQNTFFPVGNCTVYVIDDKGNRFDFISDTKGFYTARIDQEFLTYNSAFQLHVVTAEGDSYVSDFDTIYGNAPIDSLYYFTETHYSANTGNETDGVQFYIDVKGRGNTSPYYRWLISETWEYHARYTIDFIAEGNGVKEFPNKDSLYFCYSTENVSGLFLSSTVNLEQNEKKQIPLHFIAQSNIKLSQLYSFLVNQYSLSESAYKYWNQKKVDLLESGGIYTTQPASTISNIRNANNTNEVVLGYFWTAAKSEKRVFVNERFNFFYDDCEYFPFFINDFMESGDAAWYGFSIYEEGNYTASQHCFDCRLLGGTITKPEYWDNN